MNKHTFISLLAIALMGAALPSCTESRSDHHVHVKPDRMQIVNDSIHRQFNPSDAEKKAYQLDTFFKALHQKRGFNGTVLVTQYGQVVYKGAFGYADLRKKDSLTTTSAFQLASVSKQFTAAAVMLLKERGKLAYDDMVQKFYPNFPYDSITVRHLLTHRSGLPNYTYFSEAYWPDREKFLSNEDVMQMMAQHKPKVFYRPDTKYDYSNTGYCVLAAIVAKVSGMPFETFMQKEIFKPLGMTSTWVYNGTNTALTVQQATGYTGGRRKIENSYLNGVVGDKGVYSTVEDLYKWDQALYTEKLLDQATLEEAFTPANKEMKKENYGYGWRIKTLECGEPVVYHGGWWHGFKTYLMRNRRDHSSIIVLSNVANSSLSHLKEIQPIMYPQQELLITTVSQPIAADSVNTR